MARFQPWPESTLILPPGRLGQELRLVSVASLAGSPFLDFHQLQELLIAFCPPHLLQ
jgi:hypothetical protein